MFVKKKKVSTTFVPDCSSLGGLFTDNFYGCKVPHCYLLITLSLIVTLLCSR